MQKEQLIKFLYSQGYFDLKEISGRGLCGLSRFAFTIGLSYGLDEIGRQGRYCFDNLQDARFSLENWYGIKDPPGNWIKHKGKTEYANPNTELIPNNH